MDAVCVGNATIDVFIMLQGLQKFSYDKFSNQISFPLGEKVPLGEFKMAMGGNACNVAVGLARLGMQTSIAAEIGSDEFSQKLENGLKKEGVNIDLLVKNTQRDEHFNIALCYEGERTILEEKTHEINAVKAGSLNPKLIFLTSLSGNWKPTFEKAFEDNPDSKVAMNPGTTQIERDRENILSFLPKVEILILNLQEAQKLLGDTQTDIKSLLRDLLKLGAKTCVVTDGRNGSYLINQGEIHQLGCVSDEKPIERTGAGDAYSCGFLYAYLKDLNPRECMKYGAINADSVIKKVGGQDGLLTNTDIETRFRELNSFNPIKYD